MKYSIKNKKPVTGYRIFLKSQISSHSLTDHSCKPKSPNETANSYHFMPLQQTHQWDVPFGVPTSVCPVSLLVLPFIFNQVGCLLQASKPYQGINFPYQHFSVDTTKLFQKALILLKEWGTYNFKCCT